MATNLPRREVLSKALAVLLLFTIVVGTTSAQLGERAGVLGFDVPVNGSQTLQWYLFNSGNASIGFYTYTPTLKQYDNQTTPTVVLSPSNGVIPASSEQIINVTVFMPKGNQPNYGSWSGILQVIETSGNSSQQGGSAVIQAGLAKIMDVNAAPSTTTTSTTTTVQPTISQSGSSGGQANIPLSQTDMIIIGIVIVVIIVAVFANGKKKAKPKRKQAKSSRRGARRARARGRSRAASTTRRTSARRASKPKKRRRRR